jgi:CRP/FNR family transcriptional activator FtrB
MYCHSSEAITSRRGVSLRSSPAAGLVSGADTEQASEVRPGLALLRAVPVFGRLDEALLRKLDALSEVVHFEARQTLFRQGELANAFYVLLEGQVALVGIASDETRTVLEVVRSFGAFVLATVLTDLPYLGNAVTVAPSRLIAMQAPAMRALTRTEPALALSILSTVSHDYRSMVRQVRDLKLRSAAQRLGCFLLTLTPDGDAQTARMRLPFDKGLLAARLGCRQENLSRAFATLRNYGVETHGGAVILHDISALKKFALPDEQSDPP